MISTSKRHAEHPFACPNTQQRAKTLKLEGNTSKPKSNVAMTKSNLTFVNFLFLNLLQSWHISLLILYFLYQIIGNIETRVMLVDTRQIQQYFSTRQNVIKKAKKQRSNFSYYFSLFIVFQYRIAASQEYLFGIS